ncbi:hypothetical protein D910_11947 [Dendroctonus ponderosae]
MGNNFTINMEENFKKNQDFITEMNNIKIERQLQMRNQMRERQVALEIAKQRELFYWVGAFYVASALDTCESLPYLSLEAEHIMQFEAHLLELPLGVPTPASIDLKRMQNDEQKRLHPHLPPL